VRLVSYLGSSLRVIAASAVPEFGGGPKSRFSTLFPGVQIGVDRFKDDVYWMGKSDRGVLGVDWEGEMP
jgi:hypothetical protein